MENKSASLLVVSLDKALNGTPPPLCGRFEMGCHLSPSLISIKLTACRTSIPRKRRGNYKQTIRSTGLGKKAVPFEPVMWVTSSLVSLINSSVKFIGVAKGGPKGPWPSPEF